MTEMPTDHPHIRFKPPVLYSGFFLLAVILDFFIPTDLFSWGLQFAAGMILLCAGLALLMWAVGTMTRAGTNIPVDRPVKALVVTGPYKYSRNPIYLGLSLIYISLCFLFDLLFGFLLFVPLCFVMNIWVIEPEERFLGNRFGGDYIAYFVATPRWVKKPPVPHD